MTTKTSIIQDVIRYVQQNPGAQSQAVFDALPNVDKLGTIQNTLAKLCREGVLENRGGSTNRHNPALWYVIAPPVSDYARELARDIYAEMMQLHHTVREQFLAEKLDEMCETQARRVVCP